MTYTLTGRYALGDLTGREAAQLRFTPSTTIVGDDNIVLPAPVLVTLDSDGAFSVDLVGTDDADYAPTGWVWTVEERMTAGRAPWAFELTADSDLSDLTGVAVPPDYTMYDLTVADTITGDPGTDADVTIAGNAPNQELTFTVPRGTVVSVGDTITGTPGTDASVVDVDAGVDVELEFTIPAPQTVHNGTTAPGSGLGNDGDFYIDTATSNLYGPKAAGAWPAPVSLVGAPSSLYDAHTILAATTDNTPAPVTVAEQRIVGRKTGGNIAALTAAEVLTLTGAAPAASPTLTGTVTVPTPAAGSNTTVAASTAWAAERATVGNLLTANQASGGDTSGDTTGHTFSGLTGSRSTAWAWQGTGSILCSRTGAGTAYATVGGAAYGASGSIPVVPGMVYTAVAFMRSAASTDSARVRIRWFQSDGTTAIATSTGTFAALDSAGKWWSETQVTPANAYFASIWLEVTATATMDYAYDGVGFWAGAGGRWAMPGVPVGGLGTRVYHPSIDDVVVERWDDSKASPRWQSVWADTGTRSLSLANSWTATSAILRRTNTGVELVFVGLNGASASSGTVLTLDTAFRPTYTQVFTIGTTATGLPAHVVTINTSGTVVVGGTYTNVTAGGGNYKFQNLAAWPTSLPGTLVSAAPA
jgi:hypothetical protein